MPSDIARARARLAFPLDVSTLEEARAWVRRLAPHVGVFKVGLELFTAVGPVAVSVVHDAGAACFLDLKIHDIPATMAGAVRAASALDVAYLTLHTLAGPSGIAASVKAAGPRTQLLGVTVLTSHDDKELDALGLAGPSALAVPRLAAMGSEAGLSGFVCSTHEVAALRAALGADVALVVPGIRPSGTDHGDQKRVATPEAAIRAGATLLVVGRPIRDAADPEGMAEQIVTEIAGVTGA